MKLFHVTNLEVNVNVISQDVHTEELAAADLTGVLLIAVSQQMFVHVTPAREHLCTQTHADTYVTHEPAVPFIPEVSLIFSAVLSAHLATDRTG